MLNDLLLHVIVKNRAGAEILRAGIVASGATVPTAGKKIVKRTPGPSETDSGLMQ